MISKKSGIKIGIIAVTLGIAINLWAACKETGDRWFKSTWKIEKTDLPKDVEIVYKTSPNYEVDFIPFIRVSGPEPFYILDPLGKLPAEKFEDLGIAASLKPIFKLVKNKIYTSINRKAWDDVTTKYGDGSGFVRLDIIAQMLSTSKFWTDKRKDDSVTLKPKDLKAPISQQFELSGYYSNKVLVFHGSVDYANNEKYKPMQKGEYCKDNK